MSVGGCAKCANLFHRSLYKQCHEKAPFIGCFFLRQYLKRRSIEGVVFVHKHDHRLHSHRHCLELRTRWSCVGIKMTKNVSIADYTTLGVGGPARFFVTVTTVDELQEVLEYSHKHTIDLVLLGGGSNVLFSDDGFDGVVVYMQIKGITYIEDRVVVAAGESWDYVVQDTIQHGLQGLECLSGIPGTAGAAPIQNIGAYGVEFANVCDGVEVYDRHTQTFTTLTPEECSFEYRTSIFKQNPKRYVVIRVLLQLSREAVSHGLYEGLPKKSSVSEMREAVLKVRESKGMLLGQHRSAGSFFKNPIVSSELYQHIVANTENTVPHYDASGGMFKIPAAWLIEQAGFVRGARDGVVGLSPDHALSVVTYNTAMSVDVKKFVTKIQNKVQDMFQVKLETEVVYMS